jgi:hypothetical protein
VNGVIKIKLNNCNETTVCAIQSMIRTAVEHAQRGRGADSMEGDGVGQCGRERLGKKGRRRGDRKNDEECGGKEGCGDIRPDAGSAVHRIVRRANVRDATRYEWKVNRCRR